MGPLSKGYLFGGYNLCPLVENLYICVHVCLLSVFLRVILPACGHCNTHTHTQNFIFLTVTHFGPLTCSIFTTTRKFFTILGSVIIFSHPLLGRQWVGVVLVFVGLGLDAYFGKAIKKTHGHHDGSKEHNKHSTHPSPQGTTTV